MSRHSNDYPDDWKAIANRVKTEAGWRCVRCGHPHETPNDRKPCDEKCDFSKHTEVAKLYQFIIAYPGTFPDVLGYMREIGLLKADGFLNRAKQRILTVHHLDGNKNNCVWWNLAALCQVCHLQIQGKVIMSRPWFLPHSDWFRSYAAGYYAAQYGHSDEKTYVLENLEYFLALGRNFIPVIPIEVSHA